MLLVSVKRQTPSGRICLSSGVFLNPSENVLRNWDSTMEFDREPPDLVNRLKNLHDEYQRSLLVYAGLIGSEQLCYKAFMEISATG